MSVHAIVVTYNGAAWIDRCFGSLLQSGKDCHVIAVDNGSTDGTVERIARDFPGVELIRAERNLGFGQANNRALRLALQRGASHAFLLNQDAWLTPGALDALRHASERWPDYGIISPLHLNGAGDAMDIEFSNEIEPRRCAGLYSDLALGRARPEPYPLRFVCAAAWLVSRRCLEVCGGFSPLFYHYGEDDDYCARVLHHGFRIGVLPTARIHHDRENRGENPYFAQERRWMIRKLKLRYADPRSALDLAAERRKLRIRLLRALVTGDRLAYGIAKDNLKLMREAGLEDVLRHRNRTMQAGAHYLDASA